jgi:hypothetical protein
MDGGWVMTDTSGFYAYQDNEIFFGPQFVDNMNFSLRRDRLEDRERTDTPFRWFDTEEEAHAHYGYVAKESDQFSE